MARPDGRTENVDTLQKTLKHTEENLRAGQEYLEEQGEELTPAKAEAIREKNERRRVNIDRLQGEIEEERRLEQ